MWRGRANKTDDASTIVVIGLGNPGEQYANTRHNIGQDLVAQFAREVGAPLQANRKLKAGVSSTRRDGALWVFAVPTTFMNRSGDAVQAVAGFYKAQPENIIVCHDDLDVPFGELRVKRGGGHAGHNGLRDIDRALATPEYLRIRLGIGRPPGRMEASKFVLARFRADERPIVDAVLAGACDAIDSVVRDGVEETQNRFHGRPL